jgi:hypothetical protein
LEGVKRFERIAGSIHVHTSFSGGNLKPKEAVSLAREKGIKILAITDYSDRKWEYHRIGINKPSVLKFGTGKYLEEIGETANENPDMIVMCGLEASPSYYWEGSFLKPVCRDYNKHILVLGLEGPDELENLPLAARKNSGYDRYSGSHGIEPYQKFIDYVNLHGGLTFWAHPDMEDNFRYLNARLYTPAYAEDLKGISGYTGFSVLPRGEGMAEPGGCWDEILSDYCEGRREKPVKDGKANEFVSMGETFPNAADSVTVSVDVESKAPLRKVVLVRDGVVVKESDERQFEFMDNLSSLREKVFYRLIVEDVQGSKLFSNPVFVKR